MSRTIKPGYGGPPQTCTLPVLREVPESDCRTAQCGTKTVEPADYLLRVTNPDKGPPASFFGNVRITEDGQMRLTELDEPRITQ